MNKRTLQTLQELAHIHRTLQEYQAYLKRLSHRYPDKYISLPPACVEGLGRVCCGLEDLAAHLAEIENLPPKLADLSCYPHKNSKITS